MKNKWIINLLAVFIFSSLIMGCGDDKNDHEHVGSVTYTCPMHPQIVEQQPGTCPICGMDLVVFDRSDSSKVIMLDSNQRALAAITTMVVGDTSLNTGKMLNARVVPNPENNRVIASRIGGRIEWLSTKETGVRINKGDLLYRIYSEELESLQQEYLIAAAQKNEFPNDEQFGRIENAARQRLLLFGQTAGQINALVNSKQINPVAAFYAPESGVVTEILINEGAYVNEGSPLLRLEKFDEVWIEADVYASERSAIKTGYFLQVITGTGRKTERMQVEFIDPVLREGSQISTIRGRIPNSGGNLIPGTQVTVVLPEQNTGAIVVPVESIIQDSRGSHIWVEVSPNQFEPRSVTTGKQDNRQTVLTGGVESGEKVVTSGAYLLYSEFVLKKGNFE